MKNTLKDEHSERQKEIDAAKRKAAEAQQAAYQQMEKVLAEEAALYENRQAERRAEKQEYKDLAAYYRELSLNTTDRAKADELAQWALDNERKARNIIIEGEPEPEHESLAAPKPAWWETHRQKVAIGMVLITSLVIAVASEYFHMFRETILAANAHLPPEQQMQPYDDTSLQKFAYEKFVQFTDLPVALLMLLLVMPPVAFYVLPVVKSKPDFWHEFKHELTPFQRCVIATCFLLGFLLLSVLAHLVKS